jgi:hypothetical protein
MAVSQSLHSSSRHVVESYDELRHIFNWRLNEQRVRSAYQLPASSTFLSEQISHQQPASSTFLSQQTSTSHQPPAKRTGCMNLLSSLLSCKANKNKWLGSMHNPIRRGGIITSRCTRSTICICAVRRGTLEQHATPSQARMDQWSATFLMSQEHPPIWRMSSLTSPSFWLHLIQHTSEPHPTGFGKLSPGQLQN